MPKPFDAATKRNEDDAEEFAKGRIEEAQRLIFLLGEKQFGPRRQAQ